MWFILLFLLKMHCGTQIAAPRYVKIECCNFDKVCERVCVRCGVWYIDMNFENLMSNFGHVFYEMFVCEHLHTIFVFPIIKMKKKINKSKESNCVRIVVQSATVWGDRNRNQMQSHTHNSILLNGNGTVAPTFLMRINFPNKLQIITFYCLHIRCVCVREWNSLQSKPHFKKYYLNSKTEVCRIFCEEFEWVVEVMYSAFKKLLFILQNPFLNGFLYSLLYCIEINHNIQWKFIDAVIFFCCWYLFCITYKYNIFTVHIQTGDFGLCHVVVVDWLVIVLGIALLLTLRLIHLFWYFI